MPAEPRRSSQHRAATRGAATVMAASDGPRRLSTAALRAPCEAPRAAARQPPRLRPLSERRYRMPDPQPASRRAVRSRGRESAGNGGGYLAQRGLGSPGARPARRGAAAASRAPNGLEICESAAAALELLTVRRAGLAPAQAAAEVLRPPDTEHESLTVSTVTARARQLTWSFSMV